jgi:eukaryotic-like serine/threonine-protein kinase
MKRVFLLLIRTLILLLIALASAVAAMRLAIHGREVQVPRLVGLTPAQAEQVALSHGLILQSEGKFYSAEVPLGRILSQIPAPDSKIRRGWWVRVVESLGPQRAPVPNVIGESIRAAELNVTRRGLQSGEVAQAALPDFPAETVLAQSPSPELRHISSPRVNLLTAAPPVNAFYVMPKLVGKHVSEVMGAIEQSGFPAPKIRIAPTAVSRFEAESAQDSNVPSSGAIRADSPVGLIVRQSPAAGTKVSQATQITLEVAR